MEISKIKERFFASRDDIICTEASRAVLTCLIVVRVCIQLFVMELISILFLLFTFWPATTTAGVAIFTDL